ncbi:FkbM family methyltransferase [Flavobacterium sp.]|jgi:FkbM family methyltransferase|uniref:FkbM family methyltransferase n=1 Tax=Flavobacterium sp. TaxID=239 RepID=UPI002A8038E5|nr:FkbM family methyltransferase [Flavobacterium sp.]
MKKESLGIRISRKLRPLFLNKWTEKLLRNCHINHPNNIFLKMMIPPSYFHKKVTIRKIVCNGINMELNLCHYNDHLTYWFAAKDTFLNNILRFVQPQDVVLDIGVNIGFYLLNFAKKANQGKVYGFEPNPTVFEFAKKNCELNQFKHVKLHNIGLGHVASSFQMAQINDNLGMNKIIAESTSGSFTVQVQRLDDFVNQENINKVDIMKIDVEGFEMNVLLGAEAVIENHKPFLFIEIDEANLNENNASFLMMSTWLVNKGYVIKNAFSLEDLQPNETSNHFDIIAVHEDKLNLFQQLKK